MNIEGRAEGDINAQVVSAGLKAELNNLTSECNSSSDLQVDYYATILPDKLPIDISELNKAIEEFPSRMKDINNGKGVPITVIIVHLVFHLPGRFKIVSPYNHWIKVPSFHIEGFSCKEIPKI